MERKKGRDDERWIEWRERRKDKGCEEGWREMKRVGWEVKRNGEKGVRVGREGRERGRGERERREGVGEGGKKGLNYTTPPLFIM